MTPALLTDRAVLATVVTKVTAPMLFSTAMEPGTNVFDTSDVVAPVVGEVCSIEMTGLASTVRVNVQVPESPSLSVTVPEITYGDPLTGSVPVVEMTPVEGSIARPGVLGVEVTWKVTGAKFPDTATVVEYDALALALTLLEVAD